MGPVGGLFFLLFLRFLGAVPLAAFESLPVLVYHHIEDPVRSDVSCTPAQFSAQMEALLRAGFQPLTLAQTRLFLAGAGCGVRRPVLITFDDGYESLFAHALPVARRCRIPMTVFVVTSRLGLKPQFTPYLQAGQIREMAASGWFEFGSHSHDLHTDILAIHDAFHSRPNPVLALVEADLRESAAALQEVLGGSPVALAWPYGKFNPEIRRVARAGGFLLHFTSRFGYNEPGDDPYGIKRIPVTARDDAASVVRKAVGIVR